jgi:predicted ATPase
MKRVYRRENVTNLRFAMSGGPGAGKTTVLDALAEHGYVHVRESARSIIRDRIASGQSPRPSPEQFGREILDMDIRRYLATPVAGRPIFFDRGIIDALCMLNEVGSISNLELETTVREFPYNEVVFLTPPWESIYRTDSERDQSFEDSLRVFERMRDWYTRWSYETVEVPLLGIADRVDFILDALADVLP